MIKYKSKIICLTTLATLKHAYGIVPGNIFSISETIECHEICEKISKDHILETETTKFMDRVDEILTAGKYMIFLDIVFDPITHEHLFLFLHPNGIYGKIWKKNHSIRHLKDWLTWGKEENNAR